MPLLFTEMMFGDVNTISIPTDAICIISLLIIFALLVYLFNSVISNETTQLSEKPHFDSNLNLENHLSLKAITVDEKASEKPSITKLNFLPPSQSWRIGGLACLAIGGASLLGVHNMQKSYQGVNTSRANIKLENQSSKYPLSIVDFEPLYKTQKKIKKINYIDPFLSTIKTSKTNHFYQVKEKQIQHNFSF